MTAPCGDPAANRCRWNTWITSTVSPPPPYGFLPPVDLTKQAQSQPTIGLRPQYPQSINSGSAPQTTSISQYPLNGQNTVSKRIRGLTQVAHFMLALSLLLFACGFSMANVVPSNGYMNESCSRHGASMSVGALGMVASAVGLHTFRRSHPENRRCLAMAAFLVLAVWTAGTSCYLFQSASRCVVSTSHELQAINVLARTTVASNNTAETPMTSTVKKLTLVIVVESALALVALLNMATAITAGSHTCSLLCNKTERAATTPVTVIYIHPEAVAQLRHLAPTGQENQQVYYLSTTVAPTAPGGRKEAD